MATKPEESEEVKAPSRSKKLLLIVGTAVLLLVSQRTAEELLSREGRENHAVDTLQEAMRLFDLQDEGATAGKERKETAAGIKRKSDKKDQAHDQNPVRNVLFSSFIVK